MSTGESKISVKLRYIDGSYGELTDIECDMADLESALNRCIKEDILMRFNLPNGKKSLLNPNNIISIEQIK